MCPILSQELHVLAPPDISRSPYVFPAQPWNEPLLQGALSGFSYWRDDTEEPARALGAVAGTLAGPLSEVCTHTHAHTHQYSLPHLSVHVKIMFTPILPFHFYKKLHFLSHNFFLWRSNFWCCVSSHTCSGLNALHVFSPAFRSQCAQHNWVLCSLLTQSLTKEDGPSHSLGFGQIHLLAAVNSQQLSVSIPAMERVSSASGPWPLDSFKVNWLHMQNPNLGLSI